MENLEVLKVFLKEHNTCSGRSFEEGETFCVMVEKVAEAFLISQNGHAEEILCHSLCDSKMSVRFSALCALLKAQKLGRKLQDETLKMLEKFQQSTDFHDLMVMKAVEKRSRQEGWA